MEIKKGYVTKNRYSDIIEYNNLIFVGGHISEKDGIREQTKEIINEIKNKVNEIGGGEPLSINIYLKNINDYKEMNEVWIEEGFGEPIRVTIGISLPNEKWLIEISGIFSKK